MRLSSTWSRALLAVVGMSLALAKIACSDGETIKAPTSDQNFDDPDEPATPGTIGAVDATTADVAVACASNVDCPPRAPRCYFPLADGCNAKGECLAYQSPPTCLPTRFCSCGAGGLTTCAAPGYGPFPVSPGAICPEDFDAGSDAVSDASVD